MGIGGVARRAVVGRDVALVVLPAVLALLGTRVNSLAPSSWRAPQPSTPTQREHVGLLVPALARRDAPARPRSPSRPRPLPDRPRAARPAASSSPRSTPSVLPEPASARQVDDCSRTSSRRIAATPICVAIDAPRRAGGAGAAHRATRPAWARCRRSPPSRRRSGGPEHVAHRRRSPTTAPSRDASQTLVEDIRATPGALPGRGRRAWPASFVDQKASLAAHLPAGRSPSWRWPPSSCSS